MSSFTVIRLSRESGIVEQWDWYVALLPGNVGSSNTKSNNANFRMPDFGYEKLLRSTLILIKNSEDAIQAYRQMAFNILAINQDDYTKNIPFIMDGKGTWRLSPAYSRNSEKL